MIKPYYFQKCNDPTPTIGVFWPLGTCPRSLRRFSVLPQCVCRCPFRPQDRTQPFLRVLALSAPWQGIGKPDVAVAKQVLSRVTNLVGHDCPGPFRIPGLKFFPPIGSSSIRKIGSSSIQKTGSSSTRKTGSGSIRGIGSGSIRGISSGSIRDWQRQYQGGCLLPDWQRQHPEDW